MYSLQLADNIDSFLSIKTDGSPILSSQTDDVHKAYIIPIKSDSNTIDTQQDIVINIKSAKGFYLCSEPDGNLICNRIANGPWEMFTLSQSTSATLKCSRKSYCLYDHQGNILFNGQHFILALCAYPFKTSLDLFPQFYGVDIYSLGRALCNATTNIFPPEFLFSLSAHKTDRRRKLSCTIQEHLRNNSSIPVFVSSIYDIYHSSHPACNQYDIRPLPADLGPGQKINNGNPCIVILNNNNIHHTYGDHLYIDLYSSNPHAWFAVWDYDNHHWISNSFLAALYSDSYIPAHHENISNLSNLAGHALKVVPCGVSQFLYSDLFELVNQIDYYFSARQIVTGMHRYYKQFRLRNALIERVASSFPGDVGFTEPNSYRSNDYKKNLRYWSSFALSFVAPVHGDLPIRIFDSIATGSIPLVPFSILTNLERIGVPSTYFIPYSFTDLENPNEFVLRAYDRYLQLGASAASERIIYGANSCHISASISSIIDICYTMLGIKKGAVS